MKLRLGLEGCIIMACIYKLIKLVIIKLKNRTYPKDLAKELTKQNFMQKEDIILLPDVEKILKMEEDFH